MKNLITIIGKSNVGKSSLFNFLIKKKCSLVSPLKNTTINRNFGVFNIKKTIYNIIDTGGYNVFFDKNKIKKKIFEQIILSIKESFLILLIIDVIKGINFLDYDLMLRIKSLNKKFFIVINKIDIKKNIINYNDLFKYGINEKNIFYISVTHNRGIDKLLKGIHNICKKKQNKKDKKKNINISILGYPNSGKSTFINSFFLDNNKSIVSEIEGTTIDTLFFKKEYKKIIFTLIDTPGIKKKFKLNKNKKKFLLITKKVIKESDICILIIDIVLGISKNVLYIKDLIIKYKKGIIVIFNKCDLLNNNEIIIIKKQVKYYFNNYIPLFFFSLKYNFTKKKIKIIKKKIYKIFINRKKKYLTSFLNKKLLSPINNKKFIIDNKILKIRFCYQNKEKEFPFFIFISNLEKKINIRNIKFIKKLIREKINNFIGIPIDLKLKKKKC
ncbi:MAG: 50S ribosome-binding GTPase [Candidatus Shikimatogenerans bostrichidophilus]|nr:MAG: 50S ribosome-binding GTPase [Candidatus Shikimatogenerans bostrichidophilus]